MHEITEATAQNLRELRTQRGLNQDEIATVLGLQKHNISKIETGTRALAPAEKALLDLYFFGKIPFDLVDEKVLDSVLDFSSDQWRVICILANRNSTTPGKWIANQIRSYLAWDPDAKAAHAEIIRERFQSIPVEDNARSIVAEEPK
jgi:transcriptional regulator with XRE-family HTH domain